MALPYDNMIPLTTRNIPSVIPIVISIRVPCKFSVSQIGAEITVTQADNILNIAVKSNVLNFTSLNIST